MRTRTLALPASTGTRFLLGRAPNCDCVVPEECVSRRHAQVWNEEGRWWLRDLGSRNGTRVNGVRVTERTEVRPGDRVNLGGAVYRLSARGAAYA
jgi:pSer/pThr/pTyr-binding forkhead associated (FHA) protein